MTTTSKRAEPSPDTFVSELLVCIPDLRRYAGRLERDKARAEDLLQDTVERALRFRASYQEGTYLRAWLFRMERNLFISRRRRLAVERKAECRLKGEGEGAWMTEAGLPHPGLSRPVRRAFEKLAPEQREVLGLVDLEEYSYLDAAAALSVPVGTVMSRLHRARNRLKEAIQALPHAA